MGTIDGERAVRAVGMSAPLSIVRGAGEAARRGILIRTGEAFQGFHLVKKIVLDKTGALTGGAPWSSRSGSSMESRRTSFSPSQPPRRSSSSPESRQSVTLAFLFNGIGIPVAATGVVYPVWAMAVMAVSVTPIFINSLWARPQLFSMGILSIERRRAFGAAASHGGPQRSRRRAGTLVYMV